MTPPWTLGTLITNSFSFLHLIIIPLSLIIPPSLIGVIFISTWKDIFISESLLRGWMGTSRMITYNLELTWTIHFEMICMRRRIIGLLQSQDLDGKPTFGFIVTGWSVNELFCLKAPRGGIVVVGCCRRRPSTLKINVVFWKGRLGLPLNRVVFVFMSWRSYGRLSIASLWKHSHQEIPPPPFSSASV